MDVCLSRTDQRDLVIFPPTHSVVPKQRSCYKVKHHRRTAGILWLSWNSPAVVSQGIRNSGQVLFIAVWNCLSDRETVVLTFSCHWILTSVMRCFEVGEILS